MFLICSSERVLGCALYSLSKKWKVLGIWGSGMDKNNGKGVLKGRHDLCTKRMQYIDVSEDSQLTILLQSASVV